MGKFKFRLESYLSLKEKIEEQKKLEYGKALLKVEEEIQIKNQLLAKRFELIDCLRDGLKNKIKPLMYRDTLNYIEFLKNKILLQEQEIIKAQDEAEEKRKQLTDSVKDRKMLDKLKEKDFEEYNKELLLAEQKQVDEIVSYKYNNRD